MVFMSNLAIASLILVGCGLATNVPNMNMPYKISNPHPNGKWTGEYSKMDPDLEYFETYSHPPSQQSMVRYFGP